LNGAILGLGRAIAQVSMNGTSFSARTFLSTISKKFICGRNIYFFLVLIVGKMFDEYS
jgi:hypothetical protein